jgi:hypothetical protein
MQITHIGLMLSALLSPLLAPAVARAEGLQVVLQGDTGNWLGRCNACQKTVGNKIPDTATVHVKAPTADASFARFEVVDVGNGKIALKADTGKFLARCNACIVGGTKPDFVTIHATDPSQAYAQFTPELLSNGKYALRADTGKYVARCNGCSPGSSQADTVTAHVDDPRSSPLAQWNIVPVSFPRGSKVALQGDTGNWLARCTACQKTVGDKIPDTAAVHVKALAADTTFARFDVVDVGNGKIALKADTGMFLARCNACIVGGAKPDFVTMHVKDPSQPYAQFVPELLSNGKYALKADTGRYVSRCNACSPGSSQADTVTIHVDDPRSAPAAQWNIIYLK